jgi:hypothetical protein
MVYKIIPPDYKWAAYYILSCNKFVARSSHSLQQHTHKLQKTSHERDHTHDRHLNIPRRQLSVELHNIPLFDTV